MMKECGWQGAVILYNSTKGANTSVTSWTIKSIWTAEEAGMADAKYEGRWLGWAAIEQINFGAIYGNSDQVDSKIGSGSRRMKKELKACEVLASVDPKGLRTKFLVLSTALIYTVLYFALRKCTTLTVRWVIIQRHVPPGFVELTHLMAVVIGGSHSLGDSNSPNSV